MRTFKAKATEYIFRGLSLMILAGLFVVVLDSDLRANVRSFFKPHYRVVLAVAMADLENNGKKEQVLKVKTNDGLFLEVYAPRSHGSLGVQQELVGSVQLPDKKDGYFTFNGEVTNLAIDDINNDKVKKILATSFDSDLVAHLNVYQYVPGQMQLERIRLN